MSTKSLRSRFSLINRLLPRRYRKDKPLVPCLRLHGAIGAGGYPGMSSLSLATLAAQIEAAFDLDDAKAVALLIRSPGGGAAQSHMIYERIRQLATEKKRPVVAFIEDVGASGGYMLACAADEIFANPSSIVGSIGVISAGFGFTGLIEKLGVERRVHAAGHSKSMLDPFQPERAEDVERLKAIQLDIHKVFIDLVKERRGARLKGADEELFNGAFWSGAPARELGLIDGLGDVRGVMRQRFGDEVELRLIAPRPRGGLLRYVLPQGAASALPAAEGPFPLLDAGQVIGALETRALWARYGL